MTPERALELARHGDLEALGRERTAVAQAVRGLAEQGDVASASAHTVLAPYWADRLGRTSLMGLQVSPRSGLVGVELNTDRVTITGRAVTVFDGTLNRVAEPSAQ